MAFDPLRMIFGRNSREDPARMVLSGEGRESLQRLQVGFFGLAAMLLLVGLANVIMNSVQQSRATTVPEAAPTVAASETATPARDPLADAGVVPDLPAEPTASASASPRPGAVAVPPHPASGAASPQP